MFTRSIPLLLILSRYYIFLVPLMILMKVLNPISVSDEILFYETSVVIDGVTVEAPFPGRPIRGRLVSSRVRQGMVNIFLYF